MIYLEMMYILVAYEWHDGAGKKNRRVSIWRRKA